LYGTASHSRTIEYGNCSRGGGSVGWHGSLCLLFAVLPLRQHLPRLRQRKGCELDLLGFRAQKRVVGGDRCDRPALDVVGIREHRLPLSLSDECNASCRSMPPLPGWLVHPRRRRQGVHAMPIGQRLLPGEEHRHPRARALASAAVQVRINLEAHYV
jgi:hypothetical protein